MLFGDQFVKALMLYLVIIMAVTVVMFVVNAIVSWKLYEKAGKPGWASLIPIYNTIVLFEIIGYKWYYIFFLALGSVPIIGPIAVLLFTISYNIKLAKSFGQGTGFGIGLFLVNPIFRAIISFDDSIEYKGPTVSGDIDFSDLF